MFRAVEEWLNGVTMYRLVIYCLLALIASATILGAFGLLPYGPLSLVFSFLFIVALCWLTNTALARLFSVPSNTESVYITALILGLVIAPPQSFRLTELVAPFLASVSAIASKYLIVYRKKHLFNPAAAGLVLAAAAGRGATWWISTPVLLPLVLVGGALTSRKLRHFDLVLAALVAAGVSVLVATGSPAALGRTALFSPIFFFATVMLTEPSTSPPTRMRRVAYGALGGAFFVFFGSRYANPELALIAANLFSLLISPKGRYRLKLVKKTPLAADQWEFEFAPDRPLHFRAGQYLEWTLTHPRPDARGVRRYFTIAAAPTEKTVRLGTKFSTASSSFKKALAALPIGGTALGGPPVGDFVLPGDRRQKLVFIAGGIGITPFRSMIKYLLDRDERRPITLLYAIKTAGDIAYTELLDSATTRLAVKTVYILSGQQAAPADWRGRSGMIDARLIAEEVPDFRERLFYISGPHGLVVAVATALKKMGLPRARIKKDFFPGYV